MLLMSVKLLVTWCLRGCAERAAACTCPSSLPAGGLRRKALVTASLPIAVPGGPATQGQTHKQRKRLVDCHRRSWNPCGSGSRRCYQPARSTTRSAATARASPTGSSSTSSSKSWGSAAPTAESPTTAAQRSRCGAAATSGSPSGWPSSYARPSTAGRAAHDDGHNADRTDLGHPAVDAGQADEVVVDAARRLTGQHECCRYNPWPKASRSKHKRLSPTALATGPEGWPGWSPASTTTVCDRSASTSPR